MSRAETDKTAEAAVGKEAMVQIPTLLNKTDIKLGAAVRTDAKEVGWHRQDDGLMVMLTSVRPDGRRPQEKVDPAVRRQQRKGKPPWGHPFGAHRRRWGQSSGAHRTLVRPAIVALTVRSAIGAQIILVRHAMRRSQ